MEKPEPKQTYHSHTSRSTQALLPWLHPKLIFYSAEIHFFALENTLLNFLQNLLNFRHNHRSSWGPAHQTFPPVSTTLFLIYELQMAGALM